MCRDYKMDLLLGGHYLEDTEPLSTYNFNNEMKKLRLLIHKPLVM